MPTWSGSASTIRPGGFSGSNHNLLIDVQSGCISLRLAAGPQNCWLDVRSHRAGGGYNGIRLLQERAMPIVNSVFKSKNSFASEFFCPYCLTTRPYNFKMMSEEILLSPIPGLSTRSPAH